MGLYDLQIGGTTLKVRVVDDARIVDKGISDLRSQFRATVVGLKVYKCPRYNRLLLLQFCVGTHCLMLQMPNIKPIPESLTTFMADKDICFVGMDMHNAISILEYSCTYSAKVRCESGVELSELDARVLKDPNIRGIGLKEIAEKVGIDLPGADEGNQVITVDWSAKAFSME